MSYRYRRSRRAALRLLLEHFVEEDRRQKVAWGATLQTRSITGVRTALELMRRRDPERHRKLVAHIAGRQLRGCPEPVQARVDAALDWVAEQLPFPIVAPDTILQDLRDLSSLPWVADRLPDEALDLASEILMFADEEDERFADHQDDDIQYTDGRRAVRLSDETSRPMGRFASTGIDPIADVFMENGPSHGYGGSQGGQRWRTREKRRRPRAGRTIVDAGTLVVTASGLSLEVLRASLGRGRPSVSRRAVRRQLVRAVWQLRSTDSVSVGGLAEALDCDPATVWRLARAGAAENARPGTVEGEGGRSSAAA